MSKIEANLFLRCYMEMEDKLLQLNRLLANFFVMYVKLHRYGWYVKGEQRISLQPMFTSNIAVCKEHIDHIVELILALGGQPYATMVKYVKEATIPEATADDEVHEMMEQLISDTDALLKDIDFIMNKNDNEQKSRFILYTLTNVERDLFKLQHESERYLNRR